MNELCLAYLNDPAKTGGNETLWEKLGVEMKKSLQQEENGYLINKSWSNIEHLIL
jgi:hypothetical protein